MTSDDWRAVFRVGAGLSIVSLLAPLLPLPNNAAQFFWISAGVYIGVCLFAAWRMRDKVRDKTRDSTDGDVEVPDIPHFPDAPIAGDGFD